MVNLPKAYAWLADEPAPKMLLEALKLFGTHEGAGDVDNAAILAWRDELGIPRGVYGHDSIPWCGLFIALVAKRAGKPLMSPIRNVLWALNWSAWGNNAGQPELGDVLTFQRTGGGHVALYVGEDALAYHVLGGNQSDSVCFTRITKDRLHACRNLYTIGKPFTVRPVKLEASGAISENEA